MRYLFLLFLFYGWQVTGQTVDIRWEPGKGKMEIGDKLSILKDAEGVLTFEEVRSPEIASQFKASKQINLSLGYTDAVFWLRFSLDNPTPEKLVLVLAQAGLPIAELFYLDDSARVVKLEAGYQVPLDEKIIKNSFQVFPLPSGSHDYYARITTNSQAIPVRLYHEQIFEVKANTQKLVYGFYLGMMFFVFLINLFFYFSLRNRLYLFYSLIVLLYSTYAMFVVDGFVVYFCHKINLLWFYTTIPTIGVTVQTIYALTFLELKKYLPGLNKIVWGFVFYFAFWAILKFFLPFSIVQPVNTLNALISFFLMGLIGIRVGQKGNKLGYYFALAYFIYFLLVLTEAIYINTGNPPYIGGMSHVAFATLFEAFTLSFLLTKRFEWEKEEVEKAEQAVQQKLLEKTLENEKMVREQNIMLEQKVEERTQQLTIENDKSEQLLLNILPAEIAQELKQHGRTQAKTYSMVTVMFADFKDFTDVSEKVSAELLVAEIDFCFSAFDNIIHQHNIEKIKTVGDAYLCAGGLPTLTFTHAADTVRAAFEIRDFIQNRKKEKLAKGEIPFEIRIGIHTGPVVAGIVGVKKFAYDIWGDTVNTASRMETLGEESKIHISQTTYDLLKQNTNYVFTPRGKILVKGKGEMETYFIEKSPN